ncbi:protein FAM161B isoform X2 [Hippocampus zosterae]|uniref:protein FAM161B isoform X2 n=1 Tax=Hippocampus zosterae TaxID=109293 RepID=UPI00223D0FF0|nr:protein FAM161B isoform X2 [Hippocampus zosterae]
MSDVMANAHRNNALVTSCLQRPVDPHTRAPLASYERDEGPLNSEPTHPDNRGGYREDEVARGNCGDEEGGARAAPGERADPRRVFVSNEEYYGKLEELKKAHLRTMAELESMYRCKLRLRASAEPRRQRGGGDGSRRLRKSRSAAELQRGSGTSDEAEEGPPFSPKELIKNMWADFAPSPRARRLSASSLPGEHDGSRPRPAATVPEPFGMTLRQAERRRRGLKTRAEVELENAQLRRRLQEMSECHHQFRASPVPAHVRLPLDKELRQERRGGGGTRQDRHLNTKPFSFLERERLKKEQRQQPPTPSEPEQVKPFKAKPVPRWAYASAAGELRKERRLYRSIKKRTRAREMPRGASPPPGALSKRLAESEERDRRLRGFSRRPSIDVPDFEAAFKRFRKHLEETAEVKPTTTCRPFRLSVARIAKGAHPGPEEPKERGGPDVGRRGARRSGLRSSPSGSAELLPAKDTDATKKRQEAVRQALERRNRAEQEAARWTQRQKERERKLQKLVQKRASANDPRLRLDGDKLQEFRKQERQRRREYQQEIKEMEERVKGRPLLLEQVAQNAKQAAEKRFADTLRRAHLSEDFLRGKVPRTTADATRWRRCTASEDRTSRRSSLVSASEFSEAEDAAPSPTRYRNVFQDDRDQKERGEALGDAGEDAAARHSDDDHDAGAEEAEHGKRQNVDDDDDDEGLAQHSKRITH